MVHNKHWKDTLKPEVYGMKPEVTGMKPEVTGMMDTNDWHDKRQSTHDWQETNKQLMIDKRQTTHDWQETNNS